MNNFKKQNYCDQVAEHIRNKILNGHLPPGTAISEVSIAEELSISRAPVREAMQIMIREGLIDSNPQKRKYVKALTAKQIRNSYFTGGVLEAAAVARVLEQYTEEDFLNLERIVAKMKEIADTNGPVADQVPLDNEFHDILFSRIDNNLIVELCRRACQGVSKFLLYTHWIKLYTAKKVYERHRKIIDALRTKDPVTIEQVIRDHYITSGERMAAYGADVYDG